MNAIKYVPKDKADWLKKKEEVVISGSIISAICGLSDYKTPIEIFMDIKGRSEKFTGNQFTDNGQYFEQGIVNKFEGETGNKIIKSSEKDILYIHKEYPFIGGTPDRIYRNVVLNHKGVFEAKLTAKNILTIEDAPIGWVMQPKFYMGLLGLENGAISWVITKFGLPMYHEYLKHDKEFFDLMIQSGVHFYNEYIVKDIPPPISASCDVVRMFSNEIMKDSLEASSELYLTHVELLNKREQLKKIKEEEEVLLEKIKASYRDNNGFKFNEKLLSTYKYSKARTSIDTDKLKTNYPKVYEDVAKQGEPNRTLLIKL